MNSICKLGYGGSHRIITTHERLKQVGCHEFEPNMGNIVHSNFSLQSEIMSQATTHEEEEEEEENLENNCSAHIYV